MDQLHVDFRTHSRTLSDERGVFYEATNRAIILLPNHECLEDIFSTIEPLFFELFNKCEHFS